MYTWTTLCHSTLNYRLGSKGLTASGFFRIHLLTCYACTQLYTWRYSDSALPTTAAQFLSVALQTMEGSTNSYFLTELVKTITDESQVAWCAMKVISCCFYHIFYLNVALSKTAGSVCTRAHSHFRLQRKCQYFDLINSVGRKTA